MKASRRDRSATVRLTWRDNLVVAVAVLMCAAWLVTAGLLLAVLVFPAPSVAVGFAVAWFISIALTAVAVVVWICVPVDP